MPQDEEIALSAYVWQHGSAFITPTERKFADELLDQFRGYGSNHVPREAYPTLEKLYWRFLALVRKRVLQEHPEFTIARCPKCNAVLRTPEARQCFMCGHDWHDEAACPGFVL